MVLLMNILTMAMNIYSCHGKYIHKHIYIASIISISILISIDIYIYIYIYRYKYIHKKIFWGEEGSSMPSSAVSELQYIHKQNP